MKCQENQKDNMEDETVCITQAVMCELFVGRNKEINIMKDTFENICNGQFEIFAYNWFL